MKLQTIVNILEDEGFGYAGDTLFRYSMPSEVEEGLLVTAQSPTIIDRYTEVRRGAFQVIGRGRDYDEVKSKMIEVIKVLTLTGFEDEDDYYHWIRPRHEPLLFPKSEANFVEASVNFDFALSA